MPGQNMVPAMPGSMVFNGILYVPGPVYPVRSGVLTITPGTGIPASQGGAGTVPTRTSRDIPPGAKVLVRAVNLTIIAGPPQDFLLTIGGAGPLPNWYQVPGSAFSALGEIPIGEFVDAPGPVFCDVSNIDGTTIAGATNAGINLNCVVFVDCILYVEANRRALHG
ncbi:MAG: hypothetical protein KGL39_39500 [Patescibacteria group bacterium]|nr:hypothetical protein [Patescibacteria group bacterium]